MAERKTWLNHGVELLALLCLPLATWMTWVDLNLFLAPDSASYELVGPVTFLAINIAFGFCGLGILSESFRHQGESATIRVVFVVVALLALNLFAFGDQLPTVISGVGELLF